MGTMLTDMDTGGRTMDELFDLADVDSSGKIDFNEFIAIMFDPSKIGREEKELALQSAFLDLTGTKSFLLLHEFEQLFDGVEKETIDRCFNAIDSDGSGHISY